MPTPLSPLWTVGHRRTTRAGSCSMSRPTSRSSRHPQSEPGVEADNTAHSPPDIKSPVGTQSQSTAAHAQSPSNVPSPQGILSPTVIRSPKNVTSRSNVRSPEHPGSPYGDWTPHSPQATSPWVGRKQSIFASVFPHATLSTTLFSTPTTSATKRCKPWLARAETDSENGKGQFARSARAIPETFIFVAGVWRRHSQKWGWLRDRSVEVIELLRSPEYLAKGWITQIDFDETPSQSRHIGFRMFIGFIGFRVADEANRKLKCDWTNREYWSAMTAVG